MKNEVILGILITILNKGKTTYKELASKFEISERTVCRYISVLDSAGVPVLTKTGPGGGVEILNTFKLNSMFLTVQEKMTLITACSHINNQEMRNAIQNKLLLIK